MLHQPKYVENEFDSRIERFDALWEKGGIPNINDYLSPGNSELLASRRLDLLIELVMIDLERRWRGMSDRPSQADSNQRSDKPSASIPWQPRVEDYITAFPELIATRKLPKMIANEYRARHRWGDRPSHEEFARRFPEQGRALAEALQGVDQRLPRSNKSSQGDGLQIRCPHCQIPIPASELDLSGSITCSSCQREFSLVGSELSERELAPNRKIGSFRLLQLLGSGSFGTVWKARDTRLDRDVALKIPHHDQLQPQQVEQFLREARATAQLKHPHIISVHEVGRDADTVFIVCDLVDGVSLADWLNERRFSVREAVVLCQTIALALDHAHQTRVIHRDLKPHNIIMDSNGQPHLTDFGLARREAGEVTMTRDGQLLGTPAYMSPEQAKGESHDADRRSDIYSTGVMLYELLTGEQPFRGTVRALLRQIVEEDAVSPRKLNGSIPRDLETICLKCLEKEPSKRYATASEFADELQRFLDGKPIRSRPISTLAKGWRWCRRKPATAVAIGLLVLVAVVGPLGAINQRRAATAAIDAAERFRWKQYASDMKVAMEAWESANVERVLTLLRQHDPQSGQRDLRGFEWFYLWRLCHPDTTKTLRVDHAPAWVAYSPDGGTLAATGRGKLYLWDLETNRETASRHAHLGLAPGLAFSPNGRVVATAGWDGKVLLWRLNQLNEPITLADIHDHPFYDLAFSHDGKLLATDGPNNTVIIWDLEKGKELRRLRGHSSRVWYVAFSSEGRVASGSDAGEVWLWDVKTGKGTRLLGHEPGVTCVAFSSDGAVLVSGGEDSLVKLWVVATGELKACLIGHRNTVSTVACSPDAQMLASASRDGTVKLWNMLTESELATIRGHGGCVLDATFSPDGNTIATVGLEGKVKLWDVSETTKKTDIKGIAVEYTLRDRVLMTWNSNRELKIWDTETSQPEEAVTIPETGCAGRSVDGRFLALGHQDGTVDVRDVATGESRIIPMWQNERIRSLRFSPDGRYLAATVRGEPNDRLKLWDQETSTEIAELHFFHMSNPAYSPDWSIIATCAAAANSDDYSIKLWDRNGIELATISQEEPVFSLAFSLDGSKLAAGTGALGEIQIWDVGTRKQLLLLKGHTGITYSLDFSPDNHRLASTSRDRTVKLWDLSTGDEMITLKGHRRRATSVAFSPDGNTLASAGDDNVVKLWRAASEEEVAATEW